MKSKLKPRFLPPTHLHKNYSQLHHLPTKTEPPKRELTKPLPKEQPSNKGSPSYPSKPVSPHTSFPPKDHAPQNSHPPQNEPSPDLITPKQDEIVENVGEGELLVLRKALPEPKEPLKDGGVLPPLPEPTPKPYFENHKLENLRANSFLEGENDVYLLGVHCHSFNPTPRELSSTRVQACQSSFWTLLFEFHDKRHVMEFYRARKELRQSNGTIGTSPRNKPMFLCHLDQVS